VKQNPATNVRKRGEDARAGEVLLQPGTTLNAAGVALLASVGKTTVRVSKLPRILHLTTGDEIVSPEQTPKDGQIRNSNASLIAGLCREQGIEIITHIHAGDDWGKLLYVVSKAEPENFDLILISGGSGGGDYDFSAGLFKHLNAMIHFREINVRPGKPLIFGTVSTGIRHPELVEGSSPGKSSLSQTVIGLPGNALSHFVCFQLFVRRALDRLLARAPLQPVNAFLSEPMAETANARETWWPAQASLKDGRLECRALAWKSSGDITRLPAANALIQVPSSTSQFPAGTMVNLLLTKNVLS
jgi:molybdopterin molybdotransferase